MRGERSNHTLSPTALVNETYLRLRQMEGSSWEDRSRFLDFVSRTMQRLLVEYARARRTDKRGGRQQRVELDPDLLPSVGPPNLDLLALAEALDQFRRLDPRATRVVELRYFGGASEEETAQLLDVARATVQRDWSTAKRWLARELRGTGSFSGPA